MKHTDDRKRRSLLWRSFISIKWAIRFFGDSKNFLMTSRLIGLIFLVFTHPRLTYISSREICIADTHLLIPKQALLCHQLFIDFMWYYCYFRILYIFNNNGYYSTHLFLISTDIFVSFKLLKFKIYTILN